MHNRGRGTKAYSGWQSGLRFFSGRPKPALSTFAAPFVVDLAPGRRRGVLWGQVRPGGVHEVTLLRRSRGRVRTFSPIATARTNFAGYFSRSLLRSRRAVPLLVDPSRRSPTRGRAARRLSGIVDMRQRVSPRACAPARAL